MLHCYASEEDETYYAWTHDYLHVLAFAGDSLAVAWSQTTAEEHRERLAQRVDMKDPKAVMGLPRVGQSEILLRTVGH